MREGEQSSDLAIAIAAVAAITGISPREIRTEVERLKMRDPAMIVAYFAVTTTPRAALD